MTITLIRGPEELLRARAFTQLRRDALAQDPNLEEITIDAENYQPGQLAQATSPTLFGGTKLIVLDRAELMNAAFQKDLENYLQAPDPDINVVIRYGDGQRGKKLLTQVANVGSVIECAKIKRINDKIKIINDDARAAKRKITRGAIQALIDAVGDDLMELTAAASQLFNDIPGVIDEEAVARYHARRVRADRYEVADLALNGQVQAAVLRARQALQTGTAPQALVSALEIKLRQVAFLCSGEIPKGMPSWIVEKARRTARHWNDMALAQAIEAVAAANEETKGASLDPEYAVERAVGIIAGLAAKGR